MNPHEPLEPAPPSTTPQNPSFSAAEPRAANGVAGVELAASFAAPRSTDGLTPPTGRAQKRPEPFDELTLSHFPELRARDVYEPRRRKFLIPLLLFLATCASTFWVGVAGWEPLRPDLVGNSRALQATLHANWPRGLAYMASIIGILLTHEMGHFLMILRYHVPASFPIFIPVPFNAIGTMGAVIGMDGLRANRRQIFDIGVAGPIAGLVVAIPVLWHGIRLLNLGVAPPDGDIQFYLPLIGQWMLAATHGSAAWGHERWVAMSQVNPYFMAGWVGMLITGLNMLPISQLDGGHAIYALFLRKAHLLARIFISAAILYVVVNLDEAVLWTPMLLLVVFLGIHHPPTANDRMPLGPLRWIVGLAALAIPVLCFPLLGVR